MWSLQGNETWCMIGYHAVPVIVDGWLKGVRGFDPQRAYAAIKATAMNRDYYGLAAYDRLGWVPATWKTSRSPRRWNTPTTITASRRWPRSSARRTTMLISFAVRNYKNVFDPAVGLMRGKDSHGKWRTPFNPHAYDDESRSNDFTEGTSWQYSWYVPHDMPGLIALHGGRIEFAEKLDALFTYKNSQAKGLDDVQGRIGEYFHGNEPSHHIIYLYCYIGQPWKAVQRLHEVVMTQYGNRPDSLSGNDDCGQCRPGTFSL